MSCAICGFMGDDVIVPSCLEDLTVWAQIPSLFIPAVIFSQVGMELVSEGPQKSNLDWLLTVYETVQDVLVTYQLYAQWLVSWLVLFPSLQAHLRNCREKKSMLINLCGK